jgi:hypothetical protein
MVYESVFLRYRVKILLQHQEALWRQEAQVSAIERAGGIMVGYHWSIYTSCLMPTHFFSQHVYFVWGKYMSELLRKKESACRYVLPSGIWIVPCDKDPKRKNIFDESINFVISVFDDSISHDRDQWSSFLSEFYLRILRVIERNPAFGCIVKSKQPLYPLLESLPSGEDILEKIETLKRQRRLEVFDSSISPLTAAAYSDLSVGFSINSACTISAVMCDRPAVNWDCLKLKRHPFYAHTDQKLVFDTLDELEEAIMKAARGDRTIGDYSRWKRRVNHFEDSLAVNRIIGFLQNYMSESIVSGDAQRSLESAVRRYVSDNKIDEDFSREENIWKVA